MWQPLRDFVGQMTSALDEALPVGAVHDRAEMAMKELVRDPTWLPQEFRRPAAASYCQYLLYCDPAERFSVVSFVWGPRQKTPVHDHTVWGVVGQLIGRETSRSYVPDSLGRLAAVGEPHVMAPGDVARVSPWEVDVHLVENASDTDLAISIHAYGANIGRVSRNVYDLATGQRKTFVSSYTNATPPNIFAA